MDIKILKLFRSLLRLGKIETEQGILIYEGDVLAEGTEVFIEDEDGNIVPAPDGQYGDYKVVDGKIAPSEAPEAEPEAEPAQEEIAQAQEEEPAQEEQPAEEPAAEAEPEEDKYEKRFEALETEIADLKAAIAELQKKKEDMEFSSMKPAEKEIKDIATKNSKGGAMKYFEK